MQREKRTYLPEYASCQGDVKDEEDALKGARDIIAEQVNEDERARNLIRNQFSRQAMITSKVVKGKAKRRSSLKIPRLLRLQ